MTGELGAGTKKLADTNFAGSQAVPTVTDVELARLTLQLQNEISSWAKRRFWVVSILGSLTGLFGLYAVFASTLESAIENQINQPISSQLDEMRTRAEEYDKEIAEHIRQFGIAKEEAYKARILLGESRSQTEATTEKARVVIADAQERLAISIAKFQELEEQVSGVKRDIDESEKRFLILSDDKDRILDNSLGLYASTFEIRSDRFIDSVRYAARVRFLEDIVNRIAGALDTSLGKSSTAEEASLVSQLVAYKKAFIDLDRKLTENSKIKVVFYIRKGGGFLETAKRASQVLKGVGYRTDIWVSNKEDVQGTIDEIADDFPGAITAMPNTKAGVVIDPSHKYHGIEILDEVKRFSLLKDVVEIERNPEAIDIQRKRGLDEPYPQADVALVYILSESLTEN